jgi:hypothetical protein
LAGFPSIFVRNSALSIKIKSTLKNKHWENQIFFSNSAIIKNSFQWQTLSLE